MGAGGSVRVKVVGESKEFHVATDVPGPSECVELHVQDDVSQCINVLFICDEWGSSKGGLSTFNREFAVNLAKASRERLNIHCYVCSSSEEDRQDASKQGVNLITARRVPGSDPMEWLKRPPPELQHPDVVVGHGRKFGGAAYFISDRTKCKWIHFVHVFCEDLGKHKLEGGATADAIAECEKKSKQELELCEAANVVVAVGTELQEKYIRRIPEIKAITPGLFEKFFIDGRQLHNVAQRFRVFMFGRGSFEDFALKGYDIIGDAVSFLGRKYELTFVGSPQDEQRSIEKWFLKKTKIARNQLTIRGYCNYEEMKKMFLEADVIVMPSRTEGFGLVALEAISAGVPVLVSSECGIAKALEEVEGGMSVVVESERPKDWAGRIKQLSQQKPKDRHESALHLREQYENVFTWQNECAKFVRMILELVQRPDKAAPLSCLLKDQYGNVTKVKVETVVSADEEVAQTNIERNPLTDADQAPPISLDNKGATSNKGGVLPTDSNKNTTPQSSSEYREENSNKEGESATGSDFVDKDKNEWNSLHSAAKDGDVTKIESLLSRGFSVDSRGVRGITPLMVAANSDKLQAVECLLGKGANPSLQDNKGWNLLHQASQGGNPVIIELMLSHVPSIDSINNKGATALMLAADYGKLQAVEYLLKKGADPSLQDNNGWNLLHRASQGGNPVIIELMLSHVPSIDSINNKGVTALMIPAAHGKLQAVEYLLGKGADPSLENNNGWNSLHWASHGGNTAVIEKILSYGIDIESRTKAGSTPLMLAQRKGKSEAVTYLLSKGAKPS